MRQWVCAVVVAMAAASAGLLEAFERVARSAGLTMVREHGGTGRLETWLAEQRKRLKIEAK